MSGHTLESIAKLAGVSRGTVSRVVNEQPGVKPEVRRKVLEVIMEAGYHPNMQARSLAGGRTENIGVVVFGESPLFLTHHIFYEVLQGIQSHLTMNAYDLLLFANRRESDASYWKKIADRRKVDGLIIMGENIMEEYLQYYVEKGLPFVLVGKRNFQKVSYLSVTSDYRSGAYDAVSYLLQLGHRRILLIQGRPDTYHENEKLAGYSQALAEAGLPVDSQLIIQAEANQATAESVVDRLLICDIPFDAVFAGNDLMAMGAIQAMGKHGLRVPEDISVIGYDDMLAAAYFIPSLTTVSQNKQKLGEHAAALLLEAISNNHTSELQDIMVDNHLIVRASTSTE